MNNEMMPVFAYLLQSEDIKKQSERIIQEVRTGNDAKANGSQVNMEELLQRQGDRIIEGVSNSTESMKELISADIQRQSERIIEEGRIIDAKKIADELVVRMKEIDPESWRKSQEFFDAQMKAAKDISDAVLELRKITSLLDKPEYTDKPGEKAEAPESMLSPQKRTKS